MDCVICKKEVTSYIENREDVDYKYFDCLNCGKYKVQSTIISTIQGSNSFSEIVNKDYKDNYRDNAEILELTTEKIIDINQKVKKHNLSLKECMSKNNIVLKTVP